MIKTTSSILWIIVLVTILISPKPSYAVLGDCDGDDNTNVCDLVYLINYFFANGDDPVNYSECDCDGCRVSITEILCN